MATQFKDDQIETKMVQFYKFLKLFLVARKPILYWIKKNTNIVSVTSIV